MKLTGGLALLLVTFVAQVTPAAALFEDFFLAIESFFIFILCEVLSSTAPICGGHYRRILKEFNDVELFDLMEGEERDSHVQIYEDKKYHHTNQGLCDHHSSTWKGYTTTHANCFHPENQKDSEAGRKMEGEESNVSEPFAPWITPTLEGGTVLAENPGIWSFDNFLTPEETTQLLDLVNKYGNEKGLFGPCKHGERHLANAHPLEGKVCFKISPEHACEGPYDISPCNTPTEDVDSDFVAALLSKFETMWPGYVAYPYAKFQLAHGGTAPVDLHMDNDKVISFVLYLSDGGAKMLFPHAGTDGLSVTPKMGQAHTWLNVHEDGTRNPTSDHAVQAHPANHGGRLVMLLEIPTPYKLATT